MIGELGIIQGCVTIHLDSQNATHLTNHKVYHERIQHIDINLHFIRNVLESNEVWIEKIASKDNLADMFTKSLPRVKFKHCLDLVNIFET